MGDEAGPAEREVASLRFQQLCRLKIFDGTPETLTPHERLHLIAVSNKHGFTFIGSDSGVKIFQTAELGRLHEVHRESTGAVVSEYDCIKLSLGTRPLHVSLNNTELILSVCYHHGNNLVLSLYDVRIITKKSSPPAPFMTSVLSQTLGVMLVDLAWNPGFEPLVATCLSDGNCTVWDCSDKSLKPMVRLPPELGVSAVCWSPKGKQMVVGTANGELKQFNHASELKKIVKSPDFTQEAVKVVDIHWLSTYMFIVAYIDAEESLQPNIVVVHVPKEKPVSYINFEDICFGSCEERVACYYMHYIDKWQFAITCSSNSMDGAVLGRQQVNKDLWEIWTLDDAARIEVPLCDHEETMPLGMAMDYTSQINIRIKQHTLPPAPILMVLSSEGLLCPFYVINLEDGEGITKKPLPLPTGGERVGTGTAPQIQPAAAVKPQTSFGQPLAAPPPSYTASVQAAPKPASTAPTTQFFTPTQPAFGAAAATTSGQPSMFGGLGSAAGGGSSAGFQFKLPASTASAAPSVSGSQASSTLTTPAFGGSQSSPFGSGGFSFNASQTSTPSSSSAAAPTTQTAGSKGFSFTMPSQSAQQPAPAAQGFSFKAPPGLSSASPSNAFVALSKPVTTAATPAAPSAAPGGQSTLPPTKPSQPEKPKGPPNVTAPPNMTAPGGLGGLGQQGLFGKGPPNAVAPGSSGLPSQVQQSGQAVASGISSSQLAQPGAVPKAPAPVAGVGPQGAASMMSRATVPQTPAAGSSFSVAPSTSIAAVAPIRSAGAAFGPPNAVAPNQGLPSYNEAKASRDAPDAQRSRPVAVVQQTPKASAGAINATGISATSTPAASAKPVTAALLSNIKEEMEHFNKELTELKARAAAGRHSVGSAKDLQEICKGVDDLASFKVEVLDCTKSLNEDIHSLKAKLLNSFSLVEESRLRKQRSNDPRYLQLLRSRGLDPQSARQMQEIRSLYHYLENGVRDTNACLDLEWEKITHGKGGVRSTRKMVTPTMDTIYQTLGNHVNILTTQKNKLIDLRKQLTTAHRYDVTSTFNILPSSKIKPSSDPSSLASRLAEVKMNSPSKGVKNTPMSAKKQAILRDVLSQRQTTPIRSAPRAALASSSSVGSPSDLDDFPLPPERRLRFPSDESPPYSGSQVDGRRPAHHASRTDLRGIGVPASGPAAQPAATQPMTSQSAPRPTTSYSAPAPHQPLPRGTQPSAQPPGIQRMGAPLPSSLHASSIPATPIQPGAGMVTSTPLPQGAQGGGQTTPRGQAPPPMTSSFSHTGSGTVSWGMTGATTKSTSPGQQAGVAALNRAQTVRAGNTPIEKPSPPVVNIKNLDTMKGTMPPPVTFAPVASTVDAGTAKVVTQVIAEMAMASGVKPPQPGTIASASSDSLPLSPPGRRAAPTTTQAASSAVVMTTVSLSSKPVFSTIAVPSASSAGPVARSVAPPTATFGSEKPVAAKENPPGFSFSTKVPSSYAASMATSSKGFSFGDKPLGAAPTASGLSAGFSFTSKPAANVAAAAAEALSTKGDTVTQPPGSADTGVKPQIFDFSGASAKPKANTSTPGGYFFSGPSPSGSLTGTTPVASSTSNAMLSKAQTSLAQATAPSQPAGVKTGPPPTSAPREREAKGQDESGTGKPTAATTVRSSQPMDEAGTGVAKPSAEFGSSSLLGAMLDKASRTQSSGVEDENTKLQQSTKNILSGVTFPTASAAGTASPGPAARNLFGTTPASAVVSGASAPSTITSTFGGSGLFSSIASMAKGAEATASTAGPVTQGTSSTSSGSLFGMQQTSTVASSGVAAVTSTTSSAGSGLFGHPSSSASTKPSLFGQTSTATASSAASSTATSAAPAFGQSPSLFGQAGAATPASTAGPFSSGGFSFGGQSNLGPGGEGSAKGVFGTAFDASQPAASSATPLFGGSQSSNLSFGQLAGGTSATTTSGGGGLFGSAASTGGGGSSGGFFSGLGGKPDPEAAKKNPFGLQETPSPAGFGSPQSAGTGIFGTSTAKTFGTPASQAPPAFGSPSSNAFGVNSGVSNTGFGGFGQPGGFGQTNTAPSGFGSPGAASAPAGGGGGGGGGLGFGTGATFSNPLTQSPFGSPQQQGGSSAGPFGAGSPAAPSGGGFGTFASQNAPSFGALAGGGGGFGQQQQQQQQQASGFGAFGGGGNQTVGGFGGGENKQAGFGAFGSGSNNAFGGANNGSSSGFSGGSSFTQYRH